VFDLEVLRATLGRIDGRPYPAYRDLVGSYRLPRLTLHVDHVQADPFAAPSRLRASVAVAESGFADVPPSLRLPLLDFLWRRFCAAVAALPAVRVAPPGPEIVERSALVWENGVLELRFAADLPAAGRRVFGRQAAALLLHQVPAAVEASLFRAAVDERRLRAHLEAYADQEHLRALLGERGWVAFVGDGAILPRAGGGSQQPLPAKLAVPFRAPEGLAATVELPHAGPVRGMPVPRGVTLLVGGGYHGKSTLLAALAACVYPHVPGDGRERVATVADAVAVRVDEGRPVAGVDVSPYVQDPPGVAPGPFSTLAASGSTSQAAGVAEALEMGASCLLIDEDTSAANFMARDARMQALVPPADEPIVPLCDRLREMYERGGVSTVVVVGGHGAFLDVADRVIRMHNFLPREVTAEARAVAAAHPTRRLPEADQPWQPPQPRAPLPASLSPGTGERVRPRGERTLLWGARTIDLTAVPQITGEGQLRAIADLLQMVARYADGRRSVRELIAAALAEVDRAGLAVISPWRGQTPGEYVRPRPFEVAAALNRLPGLAVAVGGRRCQAPGAPRPAPARPEERREAAAAEGRRPAGAGSGGRRRGPQLGRPPRGAGPEDRRRR
jgi:predicted ABC-class ATPase